MTQPCGISGGQIQNSERYQSHANSQRHQYRLPAKASKTTKWRKKEKTCLTKLRKPGEREKKSAAF